MIKNTQIQQKSISIPIDVSVKGKAVQIHHTAALSQTSDNVTFNVSSILTNKTGAGFGLSLTLNIEQYEYINGPITDAGIKVRFLSVCIIPGHILQLKFRSSSSFSNFMFYTIMQMISI